MSSSASELLKMMMLHSGNLLFKLHPLRYRNWTLQSLLFVVVGSETGYHGKYLWWSPIFFCWHHNLWQLLKISPRWEILRKGRNPESYFRFPPTFHAFFPQWFVFWTDFCGCLWWLFSDNVIPNQWRAVTFLTRD